MKTKLRQINEKTSRELQKAASRTTHRLSRCKVVFKALVLWADALCVCVSVCVFTFEVVCPIFLDIQNPWGKVMERSGLGFEHFCLEVV